MINYPVPDIITDVINNGLVVNHLIQEAKTGAISMNNDHIQNNGHVPPSPEIMSELGAAVENLNNPRKAHLSRRLYRQWIDKVDWRQASPEVLNEAMGITFSFSDTKSMKRLTGIGVERFPDLKLFKQAWKIFERPPMRMVPTQSSESAESFDATFEWLDQHAHEYELGHWLAVKDGKLVADAPTSKELTQILNQLRERGEHEGGALVHKVIS